jgi:hypothetical protein
MFLKFYVLGIALALRAPSFLSMLNHHLRSQEGYDSNSLKSVGFQKNPYQPIEMNARSEKSLRGSVHFGRYGYGLLMKNFSLGLYIFLNIPPK